MKTLAIFSFSMMFYGIPVLIILTHFLHILLSKKYDNIWFNENFYSLGEIAVYSSYPFSLVRGISYISAVCLPFIARKRYFDLSPIYSLHWFLKILCYIWLILFILAVAMAVILVASFFILE